MAGVAGAERLDRSRASRPCPSAASSATADSRGARRPSSSSRCPSASTLNAGIRRVPDARLRLALVLVVGEVVQLVLDDRAAERRAELLVRRSARRGCSTGFSALNSAVAEVAAERARTAGCVPDLVIAFTCTPVDRPCVASNRFEMNWNSAIESWLNRGWPPVPMFGRHLLAVDVELELARLAAVAVRQRRGRRWSSVVRLPGASSASAIQLRPVHRQLLHLPRIDVAAQARRRDVRAAALRR